MGENKLTEFKLMQVLDWSYEKAVNGLPGMETAEELANKYISKSSSIDDAIDQFISWQQAKCATSGFITGLGGIITLPVSVPANISSVIYIQTRMIATIANMRGYDLKDDQVRTLVYVSLTGQSAADILKQSGIKIGTNVAKSLVKKIPGEVIKNINQKVGFRLLTKFGQTGVINLGKCIPLVGGVIGGTVDAIGTRTIGKTAKKVFC
ncbi:EcsC family protein [Paraclostridium bifermentans]|uniref:EcsC family protein n=1 Tax=Paraclostridium TaxID=1849822 RepID=UPI001CC6CCC6|nr:MULTISPECIES: EcsC family protein [Paraclostridium]MBZ6006679.1 EcsC family protein [Paraclostridium bifermentans]MDU0295645.1 EcsC family protein [Paraclostridium sp. MRS3W1]